ncbi:hypothetical protein, partial [Terrimonas ferruginea]
MALQTGLIQRKRKLGVESFVRMLLFDQYEYGAASLQQHSLKLWQQEAVCMSRQALDKRFTPGSVVFVE